MNSNPISAVLIKRGNLDTDRGILKEDGGGQGECKDGRGNGKRMPESTRM